MIVVAITGASGVIYGVRLLEVLKKMEKDTALVVTEPARIIPVSYTHLFLSPK